MLRLNAEVLRTNALVVELVKADWRNGTLPQTLLDRTGVTLLLRLPRQDNTSASNDTGPVSPVYRSTSVR